MRTLLGKSNNYKKVRNDCSSAMVLKKPGQMVLFENKVPSLRLRSFYKNFARNQFPLLNKPLQFQKVHFGFMVLWQDFLRKILPKL